MVLLLTVSLIVITGCTISLYLTINELKEYNEQLFKKCNDLENELQCKLEYEEFLLVKLADREDCKNKYYSANYCEILAEKEEEM